MRGYGWHVGCSCSGGLTTSRRAASVSYGARTYFTLADLCNEMCMEKAFVCIARVPGSVVVGMVAANKGGIPMQCVALHGRACALLQWCPALTRRVGLQL